MSGFSFSADKKEGATRVGTITTPHGEIHTLGFVPVGTQATVKSVPPWTLSDIGVQLYFVNTYHMYLRPGLDVIDIFGGLHRFMGWHGPLITDSGGFQVFSLATPKYKKGDDAAEEKGGLVTIDEDGVTFTSHWDGSKHVFTPESSMQHQWRLGSDIHIAFDDCTPYGVSHEAAKHSMQRTHRWAKRSLDEHLRLATQYEGKPYQALYGSIQGSVYEDLRIESAKYIASLPFDGIAIGGVSVGESKDEMRRVLEWVVPHLPEDKPRHLLGVGEIDDIFTLAEYGMDTFDCVQPTRLARMGRLFRKGEQDHQFDVTKAMEGKKDEPIDPQCHCPVCAHVSRAYLHHLFHVRELLAYHYATIHNLWFIHRLVEEIRASINEGTFLAFRKSWGYNTLRNH